mmetsp:Transcript_3438/g.7702  ORF Transcript_3438/g.7702 Transcript_3438/m.7702 type:complete len:86 (+) Transcript_3438:282-539(+)
MNEKHQSRSARTKREASNHRVVVMVHTRDPAQEETTEIYAHWLQQGLTERENPDHRHLTQHGNDKNFAFVVARMTPRHCRHEATK